jgi:hypothetical protein
VAVLFIKQFPCGVEKRPLRGEATQGSDKASGVGALRGRKMPETAVRQGVSLITPRVSPGVGTRNKKNITVVCVDEGGWR